MIAPAELQDLDPFDLPDWLGTHQVTWRPDADVDHRGEVTGELSSTNVGESVVCDLLAVDIALPAPVVSEDVRHAAHLAWRDGQVLVAQRGGRMVLAVPGVGFDPELAMETLRRLSKAVGASADKWLVALRIGNRR